MPGSSNWFAVPLVRFPNLTVIDGRRAGFPRSAFTDEVHLHAQGRRVLSESLATVLNRQSEPAHGNTSPAASDPSQRWIALPPFHSPSSVVPIEDLSQSQLAVRNAEERRRCAPPPARTRAYALSRPAADPVMKAPPAPTLKTSFPRSAWECISGRSASSSALDVDRPARTTRSVADGIPTRSVGTRERRDRPIRPPYVASRLLACLG